MAVGLFGFCHIFFNNIPPAVIGGPRPVAVSRSARAGIRSLPLKPTGQNVMQYDTPKSRLFQPSILVALGDEELRRFNSFSAWNEDRRI